MVLTLELTRFRGHIRQIHQDPYESYGMLRVRVELIEQCVCISRQRVAQRMRQAGTRLSGVSMV